MTDNKKSLHVKTGDRVIITAGKDKGKTGNVKKSIPSEGQVVVEGVNMITKATKANPAYGIQGGLIKKEAPLDSSNVMIVCPSCEKPTRIKHAVVDGKKVRVCKKCGKTISSYNYYKYNFPALRDEYINRNKAKTAELFPGVLKLTNLNSNKKNEFVANSISLRIRNNCAVFFYTVDSSVASYADFLYENKIWYLRDNNSQNGTWLNGERILPNKKYELCSGDEIDFAGKEIFAFYKK